MQYDKVQPVAYIFNSFIITMWSGPFKGIVHLGNGDDSYAGSLCRLQTTCREIYGKMQKN